MMSGEEVGFDEALEESEMMRDERGRFCRSYRWELRRVRTEGGSGG